MFTYVIYLPDFTMKHIAKTKTTKKAQTTMAMDVLSILCKTEKDQLSKYKLNFV